MTYSRCGLLIKGDRRVHCPSKQSWPDPIKFTSEIWDKEIIFLDTTLLKGERFSKQSFISAHILHLSAQKLSNTLTSLPATHQGLEKGIVGRGDWLWKPADFKETSLCYGFRLVTWSNYEKGLWITRTCEVKFSERKSALPFVTTYHPALPNLRTSLWAKSTVAKRNIQTHLFSMSTWAAFGLSTLYSILGIGACSFLLTAG